MNNTNTTELNCKQRIVLQVAMMKQIRDLYSLRNTKIVDKRFFRDDLRQAVGILRAIRLSDIIQLSRI